MNIMLSNTRLFRGIGSDELPLLLQCLGAAQKHYDRGETILAEGTPTEQLGMVLMTHGAIDRDIYACSGLSISDPLDQVALLSYFHIAPSGRGNGTFWLRDLIMPFYADQGYTAVYLKTSHPRAFPLYDRLGAVIGNYTFPSDNGEHMRVGRIYRLPLVEKPLPEA